MLLCCVHGATSFDYLKTVNNVTYSTFKLAAKERGLLQEDNEWENFLQEASVVQTGKQLRFIFSTILLFCEPGKE